MGKKAFNVACCHMNELLVPDGIIIPVEVFDRYLNGEDLEELFARIENRLGNGERIIVRSSALGEDSGETSYAGQYSSVICRNSAAEIRSACETCWSSSFSCNVEAYQRRMEPGKEAHEHGMGLLIQKVVNASSSGVCFTRDPLKGNKDVFILNAVHGLGESLVSGEVLADYYEFDIKQKGILEKTPMRQTHWRSPESPNRLSPLPQNLKEKPAINVSQIEEVVGMAQKVKMLFNRDIDIEWAYEGGNLFLLQARPITSVVNRKEFQFWTRDNVADVIPDAVTPLTWSLVKDGVNKGFKGVISDLGFEHSEIELFKVFDGRVYFNQTAYQRMLNVDIKHSTLVSIKIGLRYLWLLLTLKKKVIELLKRFSNHLNSHSPLSEIQAMSYLKEMLDRYMRIHIRVTVMMELGFLITRKMIGRFIPKDEENEIIDGLVTGLDAIESTSSGEALWNLASLVIEEKEISDAILSSSDKEVPGLLRKFEGIYSKKWEEFIEDYGHCSLKEFEIYFPRWADDPSFVIKTLKHYIQEGKRIDLESNKRLCLEKRRKSERNLLVRVPSIYRIPLRFYIKHIGQCSIWRESIKQRIVKIMAKLREKALILANEFSIDPFEKVFFLTLEEITEFKQNASKEIAEKVSLREMNWKRADRAEAFKEIRVYSDGGIVKMPYISGSGSILNGMPLSNGRFSGPARIITDPSQVGELKIGDVIVAHSTNPSWTPLFTLAGAIVTDMGNYLSHGAIVAREMGIPAVGNLFDATKRIKDGEMVLVDGDNGIVHLVQEEPP